MSVIASLASRQSAPLLVQKAAGFTAERESIERELLAMSIALPLTQCAAWQQVNGLANSVMVVLRDNAGRPVHALTASIAASRALPAHRVYRVQRLGSRGEHADAALISALERLARQDPLALRVTVEVFERNQHQRLALTQALSASG